MNKMNISSNTPAATGLSESENFYLFSRRKLTQLSKWSSIEKSLSEKNLLARPLKLDDYENGYLQLLSQLTKVGSISKDEFEERYKLMKSCNQPVEHYVIVVIEDKTTKRVVAASTLFLELKFIHQCAKRGRLEDVAVLDTYRGKHIGETIVKIIVELARESYNCYKITLDCTDELKKFYSKNNFSYGSNMLAIRFGD